MKKLLLFFFVLLSVIVYSQTIGKVIAIKDGDTIVLLLSDNSQKTLRLAEVDCPESGQAFGKNAKQYTSSEVFSKEVTFYPSTTDRYGRTIAKVFYNDKYLSEEIIKAGYGWWYFHFSDNQKLGKFEEEARNKRLGLWSDVNAIAPWEFRRK